MKFTIAQKTEIGQSLFEMMGNFNQSMRAYCDANGKFNDKEFAVLNFLGAKGEVRMSDISKLLSTPYSTATNVIDKMVSNNYVSRYHSENDRRVIMVKLKDKGETVLKGFKALKIELGDKMLQQSDIKDYELFFNQLNNISKVLKEF